MGKMWWDTDLVEKVMMTTYVDKAHLWLWCGKLCRGQNSSHHLLQCCFVVVFLIGEIRRK